MSAIPMSVSDPSSKPRSRQRRDIQGLRALAVLAVVANHLWPHRIPGGFIGVDIFFVISGFLITGLLLREHERTGTISFIRFYARRVKRLVPAATLTIVVTTVVGLVVLPSTRAFQVLWDGVWSFLFAQNWHLAVTSADYFNENEATSPLQHYWSLSVEEQFYLVWPWLLLLMFMLFARGVRATDSGRRRISGITIGVIVVLSFGWALYDAIVNPSVAYFSTFTRGWELGAGALLAVLAPSLSKQPGWLRTLLAYAGLITMVGALFLIDSTMAWPAPWGVIPVVGAALVLISGIGGEARSNPLLTNRFSNYIGDISYSLYLWHFPVLIFGTFLFPDAGRKGNLAFLALSFLLAACAYHLVEKPVHKSPLWSRATHSESARWRDWVRAQRGTFTWAGAATAVAVVAVTAGVALAPSNDPRDRVPAEALTSPETNPAVVSALSLEEWPADFTPRLDAPREEKYVRAWSVDKCLAEGMNPADRMPRLAEHCVYGRADAEKTMVIVGDSVSVTWATAFDAALVDDGWRAVVLTAEMCPASGVAVVRDTGTAYPGCSDFQEAVQGYVLQTKPDLVILSETATTVLRLASEAKGDEAIAEVTQGLEEKITAFEQNGSRVALIESVPRTRSMRDCFDEWSGPPSCTLDVEGGTTSHEKAVTRAAESTDTPLVDTSWYFCVANVCPPVIDGILVRPDGAHPSDAYARHIGPGMWAELSAALTG